MSISVIVITLLFIVFTLPTASVQGNVLISLLNSDYGQFILQILNCLTFTYQASNYLMLYVSNKRFKQESRNILGFLTGNKNQMNSISMNRINSITIEL
jgi:hypothetical protein